jgi:predicted membrane chloride channel (bestrophin family)
VTMIPIKVMMNVYCILWIVLYLFVCFTCSMSAEMYIEGRKTGIILVNLKLVLNKKSRVSPSKF